MAKKKGNELAKRRTPQLGPDSSKVHQVFEWILEGKAEHVIRAEIAAHWPDEDAKPLLLAAVMALHQRAAFDPLTVIGLVFEMYRHVYKLALDTGDLATALRAAKQMADLAKV